MKDWKEFKRKVKYYQNQTTAEVIQNAKDSSNKISKKIKKKVKQ